MSYTIVKQIASVKGDDGKYHITGLFADSSLRPICYYKHTTQNGYDTKEEVDAAILRDYESGSLQGSSRYEKYLEECRNEVFESEEFSHFRACHNLKWNGIWKKYGQDRVNKKNGKVVDEAYISRLNDRLDKIYKYGSLCLAKEYGSWKPNKEKYAIILDGEKVVISGTDMRCKYRYLCYCGDDWQYDAKKFSKVKAMKMVKAYKGATMVKID